MEILVVLLVAIAITAVAAGNRRTPQELSSRRHGKKESRSIARNDKNNPERRITEPFDVTSAQTAWGKQVVQGLAYIVDGDTLRIQKTQIRLFGIDAPELNHPYGKKAKWALHALCKGQMVRAEIIETDNHGRTVARCTLEDGRDVSAEMVKLGLAIDWPKFSGGKYRSLELPGARKKLWLADARQKGRLYVWQKFENDRNAQDWQRPQSHR